MRATGRIELSWRDDHGSHREQADLYFSLALPDRAAVSISKLGERFLWFGAADGTSWLFDFRDDGGAILYCATSDEPFSPDAPGGDLIDPTRLLTLCGLERLPVPGAAGAPEIAHDADRDAWRVTVPGPRGLTRVFFDRRAMLPESVEVCDPDGRVAYRSTIHPERYKRIEQRGVAVMDRPEFPTLIDVSRGGRDGGDVGEVKLALEAPDDQVKPSLFDLRWLIETYGPCAMNGPCAVAP